eukprot:4914193-Amphidinium_carterae.1
MTTTSSDMTMQTTRKRVWGEKGVVLRLLLCLQHPNLPQANPQAPKEKPNNSGGSGLGSSWFERHKMSERLSVLGKH